MTTLAIALKDEIRRLARKEIKAQTGKYARAIAQYRREIARLKRQLKEHDKKITDLAAARHTTTRIPVTDDQLNGKLRFSARSVRAQRHHTGLSAADYARIVGVSPLTIYNWEHGQSRPRHAQFATLVALRGLGKRQAQLRLSQLKPKPPRNPSTRRRRKPK